MRALLILAALASLSACDRPQSRAEILAQFDRENAEDRARARETALADPITQAELKAKRDTY